MFVAALFCSRADHLYSLRGDSNGQEVIEDKNKSPEERDQVPQGEDREAGKQGQEAQEEAEKGKIANQKAPVKPGLCFMQNTSIQGVTTTVVGSFGQ